MLKKYPLCFLLSVLFWSLPVYAETSVVEDYLVNIEEQASARSSARNLLKKQPQKYEMKMPQKKHSPQVERDIAEKNTQANPFAVADQTETVSAIEITVDENKKETVDDETAAIEKEITFAAAPFNLLWGASLEYMQHHLGWQVQKVEREGYENVYQMQHKDYPQNNFTHVAAVFGKNNKLWCIFAQGKALDDDAGASVILQLFDKYYQALEEKYGNAEVHFEPYTYQVEQPLEQNGRPVLQNGQPLMQVVTLQNPLGGENFLQELQKGKASLYSTFHNNEIGVTLGVFVDENAKSHLLLDYKNLPLLESEVHQKKQPTMEGL